MCKPEKIVSICKLIGIILGTIILTISFVINFIVGFVYRNQCPVQHWIWQYNIVAGSTGVFMIAIWILAAIFYQIYTKRLGCYFILFGLLILFFEIIWIIISLIKIAPLWTQHIVQYTNSSLNTYCHSTLYNITRVVLIISAVCIVLIGGNTAIAAMEFIHS
jgi:hypothetical protein